MRFLTFLDPSGVRRPGFIDQQRVYPLDCESLLECVGFDPEQSGMLALYASTQSEGHELSEVTLCAPLMPSKNVFCVGRNYAEHAKEGARAAGREFKMPESPTFFTKAPTAVADPDSTLELSAKVSSTGIFNISSNWMSGGSGGGFRETTS